MSLIQATHAIKKHSLPGLSGPATPVGDGHYLALVEFACALILSSSILCHPLGPALLGILALDLQHQQLTLTSRLTVRSVLLRVSKISYPAGRRPAMSSS